MDLTVVLTYLIPAVVGWALRHYNVIGPAVPSPANVPVAPATDLRSFLRAELRSVMDEFVKQLAAAQPAPPPAVPK